MSNSLAIAAVTATLRNLLIRGVGVQEVTARPLDNARRSATGNQINLFLYQVLPDVAWRNLDMPRQVKPNETGFPPLPLSLSYLLTAYSDDEDDTNAHRLLGRAMSVLHDHPVLGAEEIRDATVPLPEMDGSDLHEQLERVRITLHPLTFEEASKLWTTFQTHYRVSAAYQVSVVLIESNRSARTPLPVLQRGEDDRGVISQPDLISPFPILKSVELPKRRFSLEPGDQVALVGDRLGGCAAHLSSLRFPDPPQPETEVIDDSRLLARLPHNLAAGFYTVSARLATPRGEMISNELPLAVAPIIAVDLPMAVDRVNGVATIELISSVPALPQQRVSLILGSYEVTAEARQTATARFRFIVRPSANGQFPTPIGVGLLTRLRIDGVDSEILSKVAPIESETAPVRFDETRKITIN